MENIIVFVHVLVALAIIGLILLQQGKGAEAGASFGGGASQTVFGSQGGGSFFAKMTAVLALIFFITSFGLAVLAKNKAEGGVQENGIPAVEILQPESDVPSLNGQSEQPAGAIPAVPGAASSEESEVPAVNQQ